MSNVDIRYKVRVNDVFETIHFNEMTKDLSYFGIQSGTEMIIEPKEDPKTNQVEAVDSVVKNDENCQVESN